MTNRISRCKWNYAI